MHRVIAAVVVSAIVGHAHAACEDKEYAQLKDEAQTKAGQMSLAFDMCRARASSQSAQKEIDLALQYRQTRDADRALRQMTACNSLREKISGALLAAKAQKAVAFAQGDCQGDYPK